ncbi:hypothetical protein Tco_0094930, partial [Tanacetum coccineum]
MASSVQESKNINPLDIENDVFFYDSPACLLLEQGTPSYSDESIDTVDSSDDMQELKGSQDDEDYGQWLTCNLDLSFCSGYDAIYGQEESGMLKQWICFRDHERQKVRGNGMIFANFLKVRTRDDPYSRRFDEYKEEFDNEIEQLVNEYELKAGRKRYALDEVWEKCEKFHDTTK